MSDGGQEDGRTNRATRKYQSKHPREKSFGKSKRLRALRGLAFSQRVFFRHSYYAIRKGWVYITISSQHRRWWKGTRVQCALDL